MPLQKSRATANSIDKSTSNTETVRHFAFETQCLFPVRALFLSLAGVPVVPSLLLHLLVKESMSSYSKQKRFPGNKRQFHWFTYTTYMLKVPYW